MKHIPDIGNLFSIMPSHRITIVGDVMLDRFVSGAVERISPEAPVPILRLKKETNMPGGAANVARNLAHVGVNTTLIGVVGTDADADLLAQELGEEPAIRFSAVKDKDRPTTVKTRFTSSGQQILRLDTESDAPLADRVSARIIAAAEKAIKTSDILILSDYNKGVITAKTAASLIKLARNAGVPVLVDPKKTDASIFAGADIITPNLNEAQIMFGQHNVGQHNAVHEDIARQAKKLSRKHDIKHVLITLGGDGMLLVGASPMQHIISSAKSVFDVSGAGDTVIAILAAALAAGANIINATRLANIAAGIVVGKAGTATATAGEILAQTAPPADTSLSSIKRWQLEGRIIGLTNGCFDRLHPGHIWLLQKSAKTCDKLIVAINSDASTRALKGQGRPLQTQEHRAAALAALPMVDKVLIYDEKTPARIIQELQPHRLIKGGDYQVNTVIGRKTVLEKGGRVIIIPRQVGYSTTRMSRA